MPVITNVNKSNVGNHKHITEVKTRGGEVWKRQGVYDSIKGGTAWWSYGGGTEAKVEAVDKCPNCDERKFIRSHRDASSKDNLDNLPPF